MLVLDDILDEWIFHGYVTVDKDDQGRERHKPTTLLFNLLSETARSRSSVSEAIAAFGGPAPDAEPAP